MSWQKKKMLTSGVIHLFLALGSVVMLTPFAWMVLTAFKTRSESISVNPFYILPAHGWHVENFIEVWNSYNFLILYRNTLIMIALRVLCACLTATLAGYAFGRLKFPFKNFFFALILVQLMAGAVMAVVPMLVLYLIFQKQFVEGIATSGGKL